MNLKPKAFAELCKQPLSILLKETGFKYGKGENRRALSNMISHYYEGNEIRPWQDDTIKSAHKPEDYDDKRGNLIRNWYERERKAMEKDFEPIIVANTNGSSCFEGKIDD
ncbi:hypothetical protein Trydic_g73 [Trypoxylus dichotomus]